MTILLTEYLSLQYGHFQLTTFDICEADRFHDILEGNLGIIS